VAAPSPVALAAPVDVAVVAVDLLEDDALQILQPAPPEPELRLGCGARSAELSCELSEGRELRLAVVLFGWRGNRERER